MDHTPPTDTPPAKPFTSVDDLVQQVASYHPSANFDLLRRSYEYAVEAHRGQLRRSGDPYVVHPVAVAKNIAELRLDVPSVCAGLLHDCVEDTSATVGDLQRLFGEEIAFLVDGVTKLGKIPWNTREERQAENFRKMLLAMARDIRVILVKLCDRLDNMRTMESMPPEKQERIAQETLNIYAPLAHRLGIQWMKTELEDLSFRYVEPEAYRELAAHMDAWFAGRQGYIDEVVEILRREMADNGIECEVSGRPKHLWSIYNKIKKTGLELEQLYDILAFRVIVPTVRDCYGALGVVHARWTPIPGRFKDYIALPKPNMYQSLHTTVVGPRGERIEVQLRTEEMHKVAEEGIAAHWAYKEGKPQGISDAQGSKDQKRFAWLRQLMEWQRDLKDPTEFIETVKVDLFADEVYVFTPKGDVKSLPKGATPIDLAYTIHTEVGRHCSGARVNGIIVPLRYVLRNGDTVEILTSPNQRPNKDWLKFVATSGARAKIRSYLRAERRERSKVLGRELLERALRKAGVPLNKMLKSGDLERVAGELKNRTLDDLYVAIGYGKVLPTEVAERLLPDGARAAPEPEPAIRTKAEPSAALARETSRRSLSGIKVAGEEDVMVRFGKCCSPLPGDPIIGFITRGRGVTVHLRDCQKALDLDPERRIEVEWDGKQRTPRPVTVQVLCNDKPGLLAHISQSFNEAGVNISQAKCTATADNRAVNTFRCNVADLEQLKSLMRSLQRINGVYSVDRI